MEKKTRLCSACGAELEPAAQGLTLGGDGWDLFTSLLVERLAVDAYLCPICGKLEFYKWEAAEPKPGEIEVCPVCGTEHSAAIACPNCLMDGVMSGNLSQLGQTRKPAEKKGKKPPWEL